MDNIQWSFIIINGITSSIILIALYKINQKLNRIKHLNEQILSKFQENEISMKAYHYEREAQHNDEWRSYALLHLLAVRNAVDKQTQDIYLQDIEEAPRNSGLSEKELSRAFTPNEILIINRFFKLFEHYIQTHWLNKNGKIKTIFRGSAEQSGSEVAILIHESKQLVKHLDMLIQQINQT